MGHEQQATIHAREAAFHDRWARETSVDEVAIDAAFEALTAPENRFILELIGDLRGLRVLDVGCGLGESSIYFARAGAQVTALDVSPEMVALAERNAAARGLQLEGVAAPIESAELPADAFDVVYAANLIHHVQDRAGFYAGARRVLKPGGLFVAWDPLKYNPAIEVYRRLATEVRTEDEAPLGWEDLRLARRYFPDLQHREFWLFTLALFFKYFLIQRYDVNQTRYWKRILEETDDTIGWWYRPLARLDRFTLRLPGVRRLAWNVVQWGRKPR